jgi:hypothetical protein
LYFSPQKLLDLRSGKYALYIAAINPREKDQLGGYSSAQDLVHYFFKNRVSPGGWIQTAVQVHHTASMPLMTLTK